MWINDKKQRMPIFLFIGIVFFCLHSRHAFSQEDQNNFILPEVSTEQFHHCAEAYALVGQLHNLAEIYVREGQIQKAITTLTDALQYKVLTFGLLFLRGELFLKQNNTEAASRDFTKAIEIEPNNPLGYMAQAVVLWRQEHPQAFIEILTKAIELDPRRAKNYHRRGLGFLELGETQKALRDLNRAIALGETNALIYQDLGYAFELLGRYETSEANYSKSLELEPSNEVSLGRRGWVYQCLGEYDKSLEDFSAVLTTNPENMDVRVDRAWSYIVVQKFSAALKDLQFAMTQGFTHPYLPLMVAHVYYKLGDLHKAIENNAEALLSADNQVKAAAYFQEGLFAMAEGQIEEAESFYKEGMIIGEKARSFVAFEDAIFDLRETIRENKSPIRFRQNMLKQLVEVSEKMKPMMEPDPAWCQRSTNLDDYKMPIE